jgi:hypothetical protein
METLLREKVDLMVTNYYELKENFKWDTNLVKHFGAMVHATRGKKVDPRLIEGIKKYLKEETSWTSNFRGVNGFLMASLLSFEENYKEFFDNMLKVHEKMREEKFRKSPQLPLAAYTIVKEAAIDEWNLRILRMDEFYKKMKQNHFWLTSSDDYVFAAVLATTDLEVQETSEKIEACYSLLHKEGLYKGNDLQTLSHILALGEETETEKCTKAMKLFSGLKARKCRLQYSGLATLGLLTLITTDVEKIINEIVEVYEYLYEQKGYGFWSLDKSMRTILAATLVSDYYVDEIKKGVLQIALGNSINAIIIAQQQAAVAAACAASGAAAASSSS